MADQDREQDRVAALVAAANRLADQQFDQVDTAPRRRFGVLFLGVAAVAALVVGMVVIGGGDGDSGDDGQLADATAENSSGADAAGEATAVASTSPDEAGADTADTGASAAADDDADAPPASVDAASDDADAATTAGDSESDPEADSAEGEADADARDAVLGSAASADEVGATTDGAEPTEAASAVAVQADDDMVEQPALDEPMVSPTLPPPAQGIGAATEDPVADETDPEAGEDPAAGDPAEADGAEAEGDAVLDGPAADDEDVALLDAEQLQVEIKGELLVLGGPVDSEATREALLERVYAVVDRRIVRDQTFVAEGTAPLAGDVSIVIRDGLQFEPDEATIESVTGQLAMQTLATLLISQPEADVTIEGHTDDLGSAGGNLALSQRRTEAALFLLAVNDVDVSNIEAVARGEEDPVADNGTFEGRRQNRRIEVIVTGIFDDLA